MSDISGVARISRTTLASEEALAAIGEQLEKIRFGSIALTIHEGRIVQLDITEKRRLFAR